MELPTEFPSVDDSLDDSDVDLQPIQFSLDEEDLDSSSDTLQSSVPADLGLAWASRPANPPVTSLDRPTPSVLSSAAEAAVAPPEPSSELQQEQQRLQLAAFQAMLLQQTIPTSPSQTSAQMLQSDVQLAGLDSLDQLNLDGLLRRLSSKTGTKQQMPAPASYLDLPPPEALFADMDLHEPAASQNWDADSIEPRYRSSNESEDTEKALSASSVPAPRLATHKPSKLQPLTNGHAEKAASKSADPPTVFVDLRPGHETHHEASEDEDVQSEVMSSASEGELASMAAEVDNWRQQRNRLKQQSSSREVA